MSATILILIGILVAAAVAVGLVWFFYFHKRRQEPPIYFRCPSCGSRLKCSPRQSGHRGMCLACKTQIVFPGRLPAHH